MTSPEASAFPATPGLLALGDSITYGEGAQMLGLDCRSWAQWLAQAQSLPYHGLAENGAVVGDVVARQLPRASGGYAVAAVYVGVNDVRGVDFDPGAFGASLAVVLDHAVAHAVRVVVGTIPLDLGRPRAGAKVEGANALIRELAAARGARVVEFADLRGWTSVLPDAVHPTALGQVVMADRAAAILGLDVLPSAVAQADYPRTALVRYALTSRGPALLRDWKRRGTEDLRRRLT